MEKERTSPWLILFRVVFTAALIACIMFIFRNSLENGAQSSARSQAVMHLGQRTVDQLHDGLAACGWSTVRWPRCISAHCRSI